MRNNLNNKNNLGIYVCSVLILTYIQISNAQILPRNVLLGKIPKTVFTDTRGFLPDPHNANFVINKYITLNGKETDSQLGLKVYTPYTADSGIEMGARLVMLKGDGWTVNHNTYVGSTVESVTGGGYIRGYNAEVRYNHDMLSNKDFISFMYDMGANKGNVYMETSLKGEFQKIQYDTKVNGLVYKIIGEGNGNIAGSLNYDTVIGTGINDVKQVWKGGVEVKGDPNTGDVSVVNTNNIRVLFPANNDISTFHQGPTLEFETKTGYNSSEGFFVNVAIDIPSLFYFLLF